RRTSGLALSCRRAFRGDVRPALPARLPWPHPIGGQTVGRPRTGDEDRPWSWGGAVAPGCSRRRQEAWRRPEPRLPPAPRRPYILPMPRLPKDPPPRPRPSRGKSGKPPAPPAEALSGTPETKRSAKTLGKGKSADEVQRAPFLPLPREEADAVASAHGAEAVADAAGAAEAPAPPPPRRAGPAAPPALRP